MSPELIVFASPLILSILIGVAVLVIGDMYSKYRKSIGKVSPNHDLSPSTLFLIACACFLIVLITYYMDYFVIGSFFIIPGFIFISIAAVRFFTHRQ